MRKFVTTSLLGCILEIFNIDASGQIAKGVEKRFLPPIYKDKKSSIGFIDRKTILGISAFSATDDFIYALYDGRAYVEDEDAWTFPNQIGVFDWEGNPVCIYVLDWGVRSFVIDEQRNLCYLVGINAEKEILLGSFDL